MKKAKPKDDEMRAEYRREDLGPLVRGKYFTEVAKGGNFVVLDKDVYELFPDAAAVNSALRALGQVVALANDAARKKGRAKRPARKRAAA